ncbi:MAG: succinyl-CoA synthetase subunit alpha [Nanoarchaeota archaeon]|nr:succinyl-CoA synthetase subunit alpha [Nanoarchaeota archaeon]
MDKNYQFYMKTNINKYVGQWVAICNQKIVSHGENVKKVFKEAKKKCPAERPLLTKVPDKETMIF